MPKYAVLDESNVLQAVEDEKPDNAKFVEVEDDTDLHLVLGKMLWVENKDLPRGGVFTPILDKFPKIIRGRDPDSMVAIALGFRALVALGVKFPPYTLAWLETFKRYPDDMKPGDPLDTKVRG